MAEGRTTAGKAGTTTAERNGTRSRSAAGVLGGAQDAAEVVRTTAERAVERWPEAVAGAQTYARETQQALERMPNQGLVIGTSFSLGLAIGLLSTGANRLLVMLAAVPAAAMAATLLAREDERGSQS